MTPDDRVVLEPAPVIQPGRVTALVWFSILWVGAGVAVAAVSAALLVGTRFEEFTHLLVVTGIATALGVTGTGVILRLDLFPVLRRLADARVRGEAAYAAQAEATAARLLAYPDRIERLLGVTTLVALSAGLAFGAGWAGGGFAFVRAVLPTGLLASLLCVRACRVAARRALRPVVALLPAPGSASAFRGRFARRVADFVLVPTALALFVIVVATDLGHEQRIDREWTSEFERAVGRIGREAERLGPGAPLVACRPAPPRGAIEACRAVYAGVEPRTASALDHGANRGWAAAPAPGGNIVMLTFAPPPGHGSSWTLGLLAFLLLAAHLIGGAIGGRAGSALGIIADAVERLDAVVPEGPPAGGRTRLREIERLDHLAPEVAGRIRDLREAHEAAIEGLERSRRIRTQFLASVSHDLKSPLNSILGFSELLLRGMEGPLEPRQRQDVDLIYRAGEDLLRLINSILDSAKLEVGRVELAREWVPAVELVSEAVRYARGLVGDKDLVVQSEMQPGLPPVRVDAHRMKQALECLVSNAVKFTDRGFVAVRARVESRPPEFPGRWMRIDVLDQGPGIRPEDRERLFQPFYQLDGSSARRAGGTGLGLYLARSLVALHGGRIWFESNVGRGSVFSIALPLEAPGDQNDAGRKE